MDGGKTQYKYFKSREEAKEFVSSLDNTDNVTIRSTNLEDVFVEMTGTSVGSQK
jgi:ABC-2 type transport system ATP-binding protein